MVQCLTACVVCAWCVFRVEGKGNSARETPISSSQYPRGSWRCGRINTVPWALEVQGFAPRQHISLLSLANTCSFASVVWIMKTALPKDVKLFKEAKECMQKCVSEFISFITFITSEDGLKSIFSMYDLYSWILNWFSREAMLKEGTENNERQEHWICHEITCFRKLRRGTEDL